MDVEIKVGDKVIRADGLAGNVTEVYKIGIDTRFIIASVKYEDGKIGDITLSDRDYGFRRFYLISKTILGNKLAVSELDKQIADTHAQIEELKAKEAQLRKQRWRLETQMNPEITKQAVNIAHNQAEQFGGYRGKRSRYRRHGNKNN